MLRDKILALRKEGKTYNEIVDELGCAKSTVAYHINPKVKEHFLKKGKERKRNNKKSLVKMAGGKCSRCGYDKCLSALEFHHLDPTVKESNIATMIWNKKKMTEEFKKCILVCSNCHREIHEELLAC